MPWRFFRSLRTDGAIAEIREAIRLNPDEPAYRTQLSALLESQAD
jgi:hypothetical protein